MRIGQSPVDTPCETLYLAPWDPITQELLKKKKGKKEDMHVIWSDPKTIHKQFTSANKTV